MQKQPSQNPPGKAIGKAMLTVGWLLILGLLVMVFGHWEEQQHNPNQHLDPVEPGAPLEVTLLANRANHYVATGKINHNDVTFLLDTGATMVAVPAHMAKKLHLHKGHAFPISTANGNATAYATEIERLELGPIILHNVVAALTPGMRGNEILLGMSALKQLEFTQSGRELTLRQSYDQ